MPSENKGNIMSHQQNQDLEHELNQANSQIAQLNQHIAEIELRQTLVAKLLSATNQNPHVAQYFHLLNHDFLAFANEEDSLQDEAAALLELQAIGDELKLIGSYPEFYKKRSVAIAGGFSAGKSEFISSLFQDTSVRLPIGIEPTTAIPTYALNGEQNGLVGCSQNGGVINLLDIDPNFQHKLSHNFIRAFGFNLKSIMPFVFLTTPMQYAHLCFIDTPGYNPADVADGHTSEDIKTAEEFVQNAEALLWLIGLDSNGTIAKSDLDFLDNVHQNVGKPLYIVLNKADLRPQDQLEDIMDEIVDTLDDYDIEIVGISAYSSISKTEYVYRKQSLFDFLNELDTPSDKHHLILQRLYQIDEKYQRAILQTIKESKQINAVLSGLKLDLLQEGFDDLGSNLYEKISKMNALFVVKHQEEMLHKLTYVVAQMEATINQLFGQEGSLKRKVWTIEEIELSDKFARLTQKDELPDELENEVSKTNQGKQNSGSLKKKKSSTKQPENSTPDFKTKFWQYWQNENLDKHIKIALDKMLAEEKERFTASEWEEISGHPAIVLNILETKGMVRLVKNTADNSSGNLSKTTHFGDLLKVMLSAQKTTNQTYEFVLPKTNTTQLESRTWETYDEFLSYFNHINLSDEQLEAIEALIDGEQFEFSMEDWQDLYDGDHAALALGRLVKNKVVSKNGRYYVFN